MGLSRVGLGVLLLFFCLDLRAEEIAQKQAKILGRKINVSQEVSNPENSGAESVTKVSIFGKNIEIAKSSVKYKVSENEGTSFDNGFYVNGRKVLAHSFENGDGSFAYAADIPAAEISGDVFSYSIGIFSLGINSGVTYDGLLMAQFSSEFLKEKPEYTLEMNVAKASAMVDVLAKGYVESQVKVLFIKGGVGGALNLIEGKASASISVTPDTIVAPTVAYGGVIHLLSGQLYTYVGSGKSKWFSHDFYKSQGYCYAFGDSSCQN